MGVGEAGRGHGLMDGLVGAKAGEADGLADSEGTELSVCGGAACGQGRDRRGGERLTASLLPRSNAWGLLGPSRWACLLP